MTDRAIIFGVSVAAANSMASVDSYRKPRLS